MFPHSLAIWSSVSSKMIVLVMVLRSLSLRHMVWTWTATEFPCTTDARILVQNGADIEAVELEHGGTPLAEAVREDQPDMVRFLLQQGANPDAPEGSAWSTARAIARQKGNEEILAD